MRTFTISILFLGTIVANAQQLPLGTMYYINPVSQNPAFTGFQSNWEFWGSHRSQFVGLDEAPRTNYFNANGQLSPRHGFGLSVYHDATAIFDASALSASYSYRLKFEPQHFLQFGLSVGLSVLQMDLTKAQAVDMNDPIYGQSGRSQSGLSSDFGVIYQNNRLQLSAAVPQLLNTVKSFDLANGTSYDFRGDPHLRLGGKYDFFVDGKEDVKVYPMVMIRSVANAPLQYDVHAVYENTKKGWVALTYHSNFALGVSGGVRWGGFTAGYAHNFSVGSIHRLSGFSSEIVLGYRLKESPPKKVNLGDVSPMPVDSSGVKSQLSTQATDAGVQSHNTPADTSVNRSLMEQINTEKKEEKEKSNSSQRVDESINTSEAESAKGENQPPDEQITERGYSDEQAKSTILFSDKKQFTIANGDPAKAGFYVVVAAFEGSENTEKFTKKLKEGGEKSVFVLHNVEKSVDEVCVFYSENIYIARLELQNRRLGGQKCWILNLK